MLLSVRGNGLYLIACDADTASPLAVSRVSRATRRAKSVTLTDRRRPDRRRLSYRPLESDRVSVYVSPAAASNSTSFPLSPPRRTATGFPSRVTVTGTGVRTRQAPPSRQ